MATLHDFKVVCDESNNPQDQVNQNVLKVDVEIPLEYIHLPIHVKDNAVFIEDENGEFVALLSTLSDGSTL